MPEEPTTTDIWNLLNDKVLGGLSDINQHLVRLNGSVAQLKADSCRHEEAIERHNASIAELTAMARVIEALNNERARFYEGDIAEVKGESDELRAKVWEYAKPAIEVGTLVTAIIALAKAVGWL